MDKACNEKQMPVYSGEISRVAVLRSVTESETLWQEPVHIHVSQVLHSVQIKYTKAVMKLLWWV